MGKAQDEMKRAVECGYWHLWRFNPDNEAKGENPFTLDSKEPQWDKFQEFLMGEARYTALLKTFPQEAAELFKAAEENAKYRYKTYLRMAQQDWSDCKKEETAE
jgi:pyruvate-ferredoxin/flavodoxin oxidoreductase